MTTLDAQLGLAEEGTYATETTVTRFFEFNSESIKTSFGRVRSKGFRAGHRVARTDRFESYFKEATGTVQLDVTAKSMGLLLKHCFGSISVASAVDSNYAQTASIGTLLGKSLTCQVNRPFFESGNQAFTFSGGKVTKWELNAAAEENVTLSLDLDFAGVASTTALASASYVVTNHVLTFIDASLTIGGSSVPVTKVKISGDNKLKTDRRYIRSNAQKKEPVESDYREYAVELEADFSDLTQYNRVASLTEANNLAAVVLTCQGPVIYGGSTVPSLVITMSNVEMDDLSGIEVSGPGPLSQTLTGMALSTNGTDAITAVYTTTDSVS